MTGKYGCLGEVRGDQVAKGKELFFNRFLGLLFQERIPALGDHHWIDDHFIDGVLLDFFRHAPYNLRISKHPRLDCIGPYIGEYRIDLLLHELRI